MSQAAPLSAPTNEFELMERLTAPTEASIAAARSLDGDVLILGAGGKMGASLALLIHRSLVAARSRHKVVCVSRFSHADAAMELGRAGVRTIACDLMNRKDLERLPDAPYILYLVGIKFTTSANPALTWATNTLLPAAVAERYRNARIVALSTGNVYPFVTPDSGGASEDTPPDPVGEYAQSCLGRERIFGYMSQTHGTPMLMVRLNYASDLRYGVLVDLAEQVRSGKPINVAMGYFNTIWQGDANLVLLQAFGLCASPPAVLNLTGPDILSVRAAAADLARLMQAPDPVFEGTENPTALLSNSARCWSLFDGPHISTRTLMEWTAAWSAHGGPTLGKPTHFEVRNGKF